MCGYGGYAEHYGRCIRFLVRAGNTLDNKSYIKLANFVAEEAINILYFKGMFKGHPGEERYDVVDGVGILILALMEL